MAEHIKTIVSRYLKESKRKQKQTQNLNQALKEVLGDSFSQHIQAEINNKNQLIFFLSSSGAAYQFNLEKEKTIKKIEKEIPEIKEKQILLKITKKD